MHSGTRNLGQSRCSIASKFVVQDSGTSNLDGKLGSYALFSQVCNSTLKKTMPLSQADIHGTKRVNH